MDVNIVHTNQIFNLSLTHFSTTTLLKVVTNCVMNKCMQQVAERSSVSPNKQIFFFYLHLILFLSEKAQIKWQSVSRVTMLKRSIFAYGWCECNSLSYKVIYSNNHSTILKKKCHERQNGEQISAQFKLQTAGNIFTEPANSICLSHCCPFGYNAYDKVESIGTFHLLYMTVQAQLCAALHCTADCKWMHYLYPASLQFGS